MTTFLEAGRKAVPALKPQIAASLNQVGNTLEHNADLQKAINTGSTEAIEVSSGLTNPFRVAEGEKYDVMEQFRDRLRASIKSTTDTQLDSRLKSGLEQIKPSGGFSDANKALDVAKVQLGMVMVKLGQLKLYGWKLLRVTEAWAMTAKAIFFSADGAIRTEAPYIDHTSYVDTTFAHINIDAGDLKVVLVKDEIHRVADAFGIDANYLTALLKATAIIHARGNIEIASHVDLKLSAEAVADIRGGSQIKLSSPSHTIADGSGGTITMTGGIINLNPVSSVSSEPAILVDAVNNIEAADYPRELEVKPQYEGVNGHGTSII